MPYTHSHPPDDPEPDMVCLACLRRKVIALVLRVDPFTATGILASCQQEILDHTMIGCDDEPDGEEEA